MNHLINPIFSRSFHTLSDDLSVAHRFLTEAATQVMSYSSASKDYWAVSMKRLKVEWDQEKAPSIVGKSSESFQEMLNILATLEHLKAAVRWFANQPEFHGCLVTECHPSTSDSGTNDLVIGMEASPPAAICEVTDIVSSNAGQNNKEDKDLRSLGVLPDFHYEQPRRFIATSVEYATALTNPRRRWRTKSYRYVQRGDPDGSQTRILEVVRVDEVDA